MTSDAAPRPRRWPLFAGLLVGLAVLWAAAFLAVDAPVCARHGAPVEWLPCLDPDRQDPDADPGVESGASRPPSHP